MAKQENTPAVEPTTEPSTPAKNTFKKFLIRTTALAVVAGIGYGAWQNPQTVAKLRSWILTSEQEKVDYPAQIAQLQNQLAQMQSQISQLSFKFDNSGFADVKEQVKNLEKMNISIIDSKADIASMLGVITRMDNAEQKLNNLAQVTDNSALVLTGALLVKDAADRGQSFAYEAEVLNQLTNGSPQLSKLSAKIGTFANNGVPSDLLLTKEFEKAYTQLLQQQKQVFDQSWKERLNTKLGEIVQIKKLNENKPAFVANQSLEDAKDLVQNADFLRAVAIISKIESPDIKNSSELNAWISKVNQREEFYNAISEVSANALAALKVNNLNKVRGK